MTDALLVTVHAGTAAVWLGAMVYSLLVVQPRAAATLDDPEPG
jgi:putative copper export protein